MLRRIVGMTTDTRTRSERAEPVRAVEPNAMRQKNKGGRSRPKLQAFVHHICSGSCGSSAMPICWAKSFARITSVGTCFHSYAGGATAYGKKQKQQAHRSYGGWLARTIKTQRRTLRCSCRCLSSLLETSSYSTTCTSLRTLRPAFSTAEIWTNTSLPPLCG